MHSTVGDATAVVSESLIGAEVGVGVAVDACFLLSAVGERNHAEAGVAVVVVELVAYYAAREWVAEGVSAHVADYQVGIFAVGAHHGDFAVAEHAVVIHLVAEILATVEDIDIVEAF